MNDAARYGAERVLEVAQQHADGLLGDRPADHVGRCLHWYARRLGVAPQEIHEAIDQLRREGWKPFTSINSTTGEAR